MEAEIRRNSARRAIDMPRVHSTPDARLALVCLVALAGVLALARQGERAFAGRSREPVRAAPIAVRAAPVTNAPKRSGEGDALRDGRGLDPNRAEAAELELLPGVGPRLARAIVDERTRSGAFRGPNDLGRVRGIGEKTLQKLIPHLRFGSTAGAPLVDGGACPP